MGRNRRFKVAAAFDTETCNVETSEGWKAYPVLYILNDLRNVELAEYVPDCAEERVSFSRYESGAFEWFETLMDWGRENGIVPVVAAYNLMFDLQTVLQRFAERFELSAIAQSSTNAYCVDVSDSSGTVLRFWDTFHLEMGGLAAMGRTCGFSKAYGEWDYNLIRTPDTPLTELEYDYAKRDVQVIPAYLRYLLDANAWLEADMFGRIVLTKTSLVRQMAKHELGGIRHRTGQGDYSLYKLFAFRCMEELPRCYESYAIRKACFRGGFTFTAAETASRVTRNVHSIDVTSMHHAYICGRRVPVRFTEPLPNALQFNAERITGMSVDDVLRRYDYPFPVCFHARIRFEGMRLKRGSGFERWGIALLAESKFGADMPEPVDYEPNELNATAESAVRSEGWHDSASGAVFAFGKLYSADVATLNLSEVELWNVSRVYEWDSMRVLFGEISTNSIVPPDYVTLQSNILYERKNDAKTINKYYKEGISYYRTIPESIPAGIAEGLRSGKLSNAFFESWYQSTVKGAFNSIYGTMAMDVFRPEFEFDSIGNMRVDPASKTTPDNFESHIPDDCAVLYTYGLRIVAGSRMHLVIAMELLWSAFGDSISVTGGDTDSLKVSTPEQVSPSDLLSALEPLESAVDSAISTTMQRVRKLYPNLASDLKGIGHFDYEGTADMHFEAWNKARVSISNGEPHITCAGLSRPAGAYTIEDWISDSLERVPVETVLGWVLAYRGLVSNSVCHALEHVRPEPNEMFRGYVTDYTGTERYVETHCAVALYPSPRELGGMLKETNRRNVAYLVSRGFEPEQREHVITIDSEGKAALYVAGESDLERVW